MQDDGGAGTTHRVCLDRCCSFCWADRVCPAVVALLGYHLGHDWLLAGFHKLKPLPAVWNHLILTDGCSLVFWCFPGLCYVVCRTRTSWWMLWSMPPTCWVSWGPPCCLQRATMSCVSFCKVIYVHSDPVLLPVLAPSGCFAEPLCVRGWVDTVPNQPFRHGHLWRAPLPGSVSDWWVC